MELRPITEEEVLQFRKETKGTDQKIHFNNAGSSLPPDIVPETVIAYLKEEALMGGYETEARYQPELDKTYTLIAQLINAASDEIAIVENASQGWWLAFNSIDFKKGDIILTCEMEYVTNLLGFLHVQKTKEVEYRVIPNDEAGNFSLAALEAAITPNTKLIAITHIASATGGMMPIEAIGKIAQKHQILYLVDACQTVGQSPIDVKAIHCDILSVTGRKYLRAPRGTGFLYIRKEVQDQLPPVFMDGHTAELTSEQDYTIRKDGKRYELYEKNRALTLGLAKAIEYALAIGPDRIWQRVRLLATSLRQQLGQLSAVTIHDSGDLQSGIVTFTIAGLDSQQVKNQLWEKGINVSVGQARSTLIYMNRHQLTTVVRASIHYYNTEAEINTFCKVLTEMI